MSKAKKIQTAGDILALAEQARNEWAKVFTYADEVAYDENGKRKRQISVKSKVHRILEAYFEELVLGFLGFESDWGNNNRLRVKEKTPTYEALKAEAEKAAKPFFKELLKGLKAPTEAARRAAQKEYTRAFREVIDDNIRAKAYEDAERFMETIVAAERDKRNALLEAALGIQELAAEAESEET